MPKVGRKCLGCDRRVTDAQGLLGHCVATGHPMIRGLPACQTCGALYFTVGQRDQHVAKRHTPRAPVKSHSAPSRSAAKSFRCGFCKATFGSANALQNHKDAQTKADGWCKFCTPKQRFSDLGVHMKRMHPQCSQCKDYFKSFKALLSHCTAKQHSSLLCTVCKTVFQSLRDLEQHINTPGHLSRSAGAPSPAFSCSTCNLPFGSQKGLNKHLSTSPRHHWCRLCKQDFLTSEQKTEHPCEAKGHFPCFFCERVFDFASALAHHIEAGVHGINRHMITSAVYLLGVIPDITGARTIEHRPHEVPPLETVRVDESSWNGTAYQCHLCTTAFKRLASLNRHLNSPAHDQKAFRCPNTKCGREFTLVSGLTQHLECQCCGLTNGKEITDRFMAISGQFTRALTL